MKSFTYNTSEKRLEGSPEKGRYFRGLRYLMVKNLITAILSVVLLMMVAPADASTGSVSNRKSTCRAKQTSSSYIVVVKKKNNPMVYASKKHSKKFRARNYSFPL
jgi:hypothetical protein